MNDNKWMVPLTRWSLGASIATAYLIAIGGTAEAIDLTVTMTKLKSGNGNIHVSVYDRPETFPKKTGMLKELIVKAKADRVEVVFPGLKSGMYAIAAFHDENGNGKFDQGFLGIPLEDFAFSRDPTVILSAPDFDEAAFKVDETANGIEIRMNR